jgi:hypothetical protein
MIKQFVNSCWSLVLLLFIAIAALASPIAASEFSPALMLFAYDGQNPASHAHDGAILAGAGYDPAVVPTATGEANQTAETSNLFGKCVEFLAAEGTATQLEFDFVNNLSPKPAINWAKEAPNYGFAGEPAPATLVPGTLVDRFGYPGGTFISPEGTPFIQRSLAPGTQYSPYNVYQVLKPIDVNTGQIAPAFGMPGNGMQFQLPSSVQSLIDSGHLGIH